MFEKGQSKRIWGELYKVVDSSDVVVQVVTLSFSFCQACLLSRIIFSVLLFSYKSRGVPNRIFFMVKSCQVL